MSPYPSSGVPTSHRACTPDRPMAVTIGHGTRTTDELAELLRWSGVTTRIDVRRYPLGRRQPHLAKDRLAMDLPARRIADEWWGEELGGRRAAAPIPRCRAGGARRVWRHRRLIADALANDGYEVRDLIDVPPGDPSTGPTGDDRPAMAQGT